jgi:hypothetical protein
LSLFAMDGWACSRVRFSLRKERNEREKDQHMRKGERGGRQKPQHRKGLPHRENNLPPAAPTGGPRATPRQGSRPFEGRRWPRRVSSRLAGAGTGAPATSLSFVGGRGTTTSQWPRRLGPSVATRLGHGRRARGDLTSRGRRRGVGARTVGSAWTPVGTSVRGASTSPRGGPSRIRSRRDAIPSESSLSSSSSSSSLGDSSSGSPLCLDLARRTSNAWRSRFFFFSPFFAESLADFNFSADWRRLSRSTSSSFTGGLEDRTSIRPCQN